MFTQQWAVKAPRPSARTEVSVARGAGVHLVGHIREFVDTESPHHSDQPAMFARGEMEKVLWRDAEIDAATICRYWPVSEP